MATSPRSMAADSRSWAAVRLRDAVLTYVPLLLMLLLAGATWWLVRATPIPSLLAFQRPAPQTPDYILSDVDLHRYRADGTLLAHIQGRELRHYPQDERVEVDTAHIVLEAPDGRWVLQARTAVLNAAGDRLRLTGSVRVQRPAHAGRAAFEVLGESMEVDAQAHRAWSREPVQWLQDGATVQAAGFDYDRQSEQVQLQGPVRAVWSAQGQAAR